MNLNDLTNEELRNVLIGLRDAEKAVKASISEVLTELLSRAEGSHDEGHWTAWGHVPS